MDWIERWFGVAPDNGDGTLELLLLLVVVTVAVIAGLALHPRSRAAIRDICLRGVHPFRTPGSR